MATERKQQDPIVEPPNSTVDDWIGQRVSRDEARADDLIEETHGDVDEAARRFEQQTERRPGEPVGEGPEGPDPEGIPDPMPEALRDEPDQTKTIDAMRGDAPTG
jgi:hypothetical protein